MQYCVKVVHRAMHAHEQTGHCCLVRFSFSVVIVCVTVYLCWILFFWGDYFVLQFMYVCFYYGRPM